MAAGLVQRDDTDGIVGNADPFFSYMLFMVTDGVTKQGSKLEYGGTYHDGIMDGTVCTGNIGGFTVFGDRSIDRLFCLSFQGASPGHV